MKINIRTPDHLWDKTDNPSGGILPLRYILFSRFSHHSLNIKSKQEVNSDWENWNYDKPYEIVKTTTIFF